MKNKKLRDFFKEKQTFDTDYVYQTVVKEYLTATGYTWDIFLVGFLVDTLKSKKAHSLASLVGEVFVETIRCAVNKQFQKADQNVYITLDDAADARASFAQYKKGCKNREAAGRATAAALSGGAPIGLTSDLAAGLSPQGLGPAAAGVAHSFLQTRSDALRNTHVAPTSTRKVDNAFALLRNTHVAPTESQLIEAYLMNVAQHARGPTKSIEPVFASTWKDVTAKYREHRRKLDLDLSAWIDDNYVRVHYPLGGNKLGSETRYVAKPGAKKA